MSDLRFYIARVNCIELGNVDEITDEEFKALAEEQNLVFSVSDFQEAWNNYDQSDLNVATQFLRILKD